MFTKPILATAVAALVTATQATQSFGNKGTLAGWDSILKENKGTVEEVTNVVREGPTAIKVTQTYDPSWKGRYHSEVHRGKGYRRGETGFYGWAFRLQEDWQFSPAQGYNLGQFIADFTDTGCDDWMPSSMVWIEGNQLASRVKYGSICAQRTREFKGLATVSAGVWHKVEIQANWQSDGTGFYKLWFDGVKVLEQYNLATTIDDSREFGFHLGLYANGWHDDNGGMKGTQPFRQVWYDEIGIGSTFADADPDQW